jgi:hypothetical protein
VEKESLFQVLVEKYSCIRGIYQQHSILSQMKSLRLKTQPYKKLCALAFSNIE